MTPRGSNLTIQVLVSGVLAVTVGAAQAPAGRQSNCAACHASQTRLQPATAMALAAVRAPEAPILRARPALRFDSGGYTYAIDRLDDRVNYSVTDGTKTFTAPILWAFGSGSIGQTYLYSSGGRWYESRVSFYPPIDGLDLTIGQSMRKPTSAEDAAGRLLSPQEMNRCFGCHSTETRNRTQAGIQCERCHQNAQQHANTSSTHTSGSMTAGRLSQLSKDGLSDFCGSCHRTLQEIVTTRVRSINNVRSQPYRLGTSKCYLATEDKRIGCVACHDPHRTMAKEAKYYDGKCQACHQAGTTAMAATTCPVSKKDCVSCHMPKVDFPDGHTRFTDHRIRIVRPGAPFPG